LSKLWLLDDQRLGRKEPNMMIGVDYHPSFQQIAFGDRDKTSLRIATGLLIASPQTDPQSHSEVAQPPQIAAAILHIRIPPADQVSDRDDQEPAEIHHI